MVIYVHYVELYTSIKIQKLPHLIRHEGNEVDMVLILLQTYEKTMNYLIVVRCVAAYEIHLIR